MNPKETNCVFSRALRLGLSFGLMLPHVTPASVALWFLMILPIQRLPLAQAAVPQIISFLGRLTDAGNNPETGPFDISFKICDSLAGPCASGAGQLWSEDQTSANGRPVQVVNGVFAVQLGSVDPAGNPIPLSAFKDRDKAYLEITVGGETMSPRQRLLSSPYAFNSSNSEKLEGLASSDFLRSGQGLNLSGGNVGIGTTGPAEKLDVRTGNIAFTQANQVFTTGSSVGKYMWYVDDDSAGQALEAAGEIDFIGTADWAGSDTLANIEFRLKTSADVLPTTKMAITSGGSVGIGTTGPSAKLQVGTRATLDSFTGNFTNLANNAYYDGTNYRYINSGTASMLQLTGGDAAFYTVGSGVAGNSLTFSEMVRINSNGNVGIGTTSPDAKLTVEGPLGTLGQLVVKGTDHTQMRLLSNGAASFSRILYGTNDHGLRWNVGMRSDGGQGGGFSIEGDSSGAGAWGSRLFIKLDGNVGIGTTSPGAALSFGVSHGNGRNQYADPTVGTRNDVLTVYENGGHKYGLGIHSGTLELFPGQGGQVQIGGRADATGFFTPWLTVNPSGNVGIGTAGPGYKLDVAGAIHSGAGGIVLEDSATLLRFLDNAGAANSKRFQIQSFTGNLAIGATDDSWNWKQPSYALYIRNDGNVGIGTANPGRKLFVNGDAGGTTAWFNDSDERLKKNIRTIQNALDKVRRLRGVNFEWRDTATHPQGPQMGLIAQEVKEAAPEVVEKNGEYYSLATPNLVGLLIEAIKEQENQFKTESDGLKAKIEAQETEIKGLKEKIAEIERKLK